MKQNPAERAPDGLSAGLRERNPAFVVHLPAHPRILIVKMWAIGDVLLATPLLRALRKGFPGAQITWLVDSRYAGVLEANPLIDEVIAFDSERWRSLFRRGRILSYLRMSFSLVRDLKRRRFDAAVNLAGEKWWALWFNVAPVRIGLFPRPRIGAMGIYYTRAIPRSLNPRLHNTRHYLLPALALGVEEPFEERIVLGVPARCRQSAIAFLRAHPSYDPGKPLIVMHPGASQETKCWSPECFAEVACALQDRYNIVVTGSPGEKPLADAVAAACSAGARAPLVAAGALGDILETAALVQMASAVVCGDTSILHMASALGTPMVAVYGSTRPSDNAPLYGRHALVFVEVACAPCYKAHCPLTGEDHLRCLREITPARVLAALDELLQEQREAKPSRVRANARAAVSKL